MTETTSYEAFKSLVSHNNQVSYSAYPIDGFAPWIRNFVSEVALSYQVDPGMVGSAVLGCLATAVQAKYDVQPKADHTEQLSLQIVIIAPSGSRKSPVIKLVFAPVYQYESHLSNDGSKLAERHHRPA